MIPPFISLLFDKLIHLRKGFCFIVKWPLMHHLDTQPFPLREKLHLFEQLMRLLSGYCIICFFKHLLCDHVRLLQHNPVNKAVFIQRMLRIRGRPDSFQRIDCIVLILTVDLLNATF